jgi:hypothetical protein
MRVPKDTLRLNTRGATTRKGDGHETLESAVAGHSGPRARGADRRRCRAEQGRLHRRLHRGGSFATFVIQDVPKLGPGESVNVHGVVFTGLLKLAPFHGAVAKSLGGPILVGLFVHSTAQSNNDFTVSGVLDENFAGTLKFDSDGDFTPNGILVVQEVDCATIVIPWPTAPTP